jgi:hypothetical protein
MEKMPSNTNPQPRNKIAGASEWLLKTNKTDAYYKR